MSTEYFGRVAIVGIDGTLAYTGYGSVSATGAAGGTTSVPTTSGVMRSVGFTDAIDSVTLMDKSNEVAGIALRNKRKEVTIEFIPTNDTSDGTPSLTETRDQQRLPKPGSTVTLAGFGPGTNSEFNGTYQYWGGGSVSFTAEGHVQFTLPIVLHVAAGTMTQVT